MFGSLQNARPKILFPVTLQFNIGLLMPSVFSMHFSFDIQCIILYLYICFGKLLIIVFHLIWEIKKSCHTNACLSAFLICQYNRCYSLNYCYFIELLVVKKGLKSYGLRFTFSLK